MSILNETVKKVVPKEDMAADKIKKETRRMAQQLISGWMRGFDRLWNNPNADAADILASLGTNAEEVMDLSAGLVAFLGSILADRDPDTWAEIQAKIAEKPATTTNPDGTVTID